MVLPWLLPVVMVMTCSTCCCRLSQEFLSGQVGELKTKVKELQAKLKKSPDDLKAQLKAFVAVRLVISNGFLFSSHHSLLILIHFSFVT